MARLGKYIQEEKHPLGNNPPKNLKMVGVSNEEGLHASSRATSTDTSRYIRVDRDWFAYNPMRINIGSIGLADDDSKTGFTSPDYTVFSCKKDLNPTYLLHFLKSDYGLEAIAQHCSGAVRKRLYYSGLAGIDLRIPSIEEQSKIVKRIDSIQSVIRKIRDENSDKTELPQLKQAILQEAIQGKLTADWRAENPDIEPASELLKRIQAEKARLIDAKKIRKEKTLPEVTPDEIPFEIPKSWEGCRLGEIINQTESGWSPKCLNNPAPVGSWGVLKTTAVQVGEYIESENKELPPNLVERPKHETKAGDILVTRAGPANRVGICAYVRRTRDKLMISDKIIRFHPMLVNGLYLELFANTSLFQSLIEDSKQGMAQSQVNISQDNLKKTALPLPPLAEQAAIVAQVEVLINTSRALEAEIEQSRTHAAHLLQAILKEAFSSSE